MISIIIPVYNTAQFLELCVESVQEKTFPDFEMERLWKPRLEAIEDLITSR